MQDGIAQDDRLDLAGCKSPAAVIKLEQMLGVRAFQLLGYAKPPDRPGAGAPKDMRRITGGWCRASDRFSGTDAACKVMQLLSFFIGDFPEGVRRSFIS